MFQSTLPRGERLYAESKTCRVDDSFNPRSHEGSDRTCAKKGGVKYKFQSTLPRGERQEKCQTDSISLEFQSTLPRGERLRFAMIRAGYGSFNPRSHEGSDMYWLKSCRSITGFNPRSHEGSDQRRVCKSGAILRFQSTLPRGERHCTTVTDMFIVIVSIHAPTRGATRMAQPRHRQTLCFNPRSHEGSDRKWQEQMFVNGGFQSTLPRGERRVIMVHF